MILADASIWIQYLRSPDAAIDLLLDEGEITAHPFVVAEIALGSIRDRGATLWKLDRLPRVAVARHADVRRLIESRRLYARGVGYVDVHLVASCLIGENLRLWSRDRRLNEVAEDLGVRYAEGQ